jgi:hypothetical protein
MSSVLSDNQPCLPDDPAFAGLFVTLHPDNEVEQPSVTEVVNNYEGEQETLLSSHADVEPGDKEEDLSMDVDDDDKDEENVIGFSQLNDTIRNASKGITKGTDAEYQRSVSMTTIFVSHFMILGDSQMAQCVSFLIQKGLIKAGESFFSSTPGPNLPVYINAWIMDK